MHRRRHRPASLFKRKQVPTDPGVYAWYEDGEAIYVGKASSLRERVWSCHMGKGARMRNSAFRRNVAEDLGIANARDIYSGDCRLSAEEVSRVNARVLRCAVAWIRCATAARAVRLEARLKAEWTPPLTKR
jgi:hypothetical protein